MSPKPLTTDEKERIYRVKTYLLNHLGEPLSLATLARRAAMTPVAFSDHFFGIFGYRPGAYLREGRLQFALFLLRHTDRPLKDIAGACGFGHTKNFLTAFRRYFGSPPGRVRRGS